MTLGWLLLVAQVLAPRQAPPRQEWQRPRALRTGDTIAFVAPAGPIAEEPVLRYAKQLEREGFHVRLPRDLHRSDRYLAGTDDERVTELNEALRDPSVAAVFPCRGGFGLTRILDRVDYAALRAHPKIVTGFSDLTALHLAIAKKARVITFHSPMPERDLWRQDGDYGLSASSFHRLLFDDRSNKENRGMVVDVQGERAKPVKMVGGKARGRLIGGNLTLICSTLGTPYAIEPSEKILLIEDTREAAYQIDRALSQLRLAGVLDSVAGVVVGHFDRINELQLLRVLQDYFGHSKVPVIRNFPFGHQPYNVTLPHGCLVELDADSCRLRLLENPVRLAE